MDIPMTMQRLKKFNLDHEIGAVNITCAASNPIYNFLSGHDASPL